MKIDMSSHILPEPYLKKIQVLTPDSRNMDARTRKKGSISSLDARFRAMDEFGDYSQVISLVAPPVESYGAPSVTGDLAEFANDSLADLVAKYPDRFLAFVSSVPMNDPDGLAAEAERAVKQLGAAGVQIFTNINGWPLDKPEYAPIFELMAGLNRPIWLHPTRGADFADYKMEQKSRYEIWWALGWSYETSAAMAHLVFSGLFDRHPGIKIITHHLGGVIPYLEGKVGVGVGLPRHEDHR
jgi:predicted TIM-barrel fold metal-dependent hydrolase